MATNGQTIRELLMKTKSLVREASTNGLKVVNCYIYKNLENNWFCIRNCI